MEKVLKFFQILNQIVWIAVGLATLYSIYWFITSNPLGDLLKQLGPLLSGNGEQLQQLQQNPDTQKIIQQYLQNQNTR